MFSLRKLIRFKIKYDQNKNMKLLHCLPSLHDVRLISTSTDLEYKKEGSSIVIHKPKFLKASVIQLLQFLYLLLVALYFSLPMRMLSSLQLPSINVWLFWIKKIGGIMFLVMYHLNGTLNSFTIRRCICGYYWCRTRSSIWGIWWSYM